MKTTFTLLSILAFFACSAQEPTLSWSQGKGEAEVYQIAVQKAKAMQTCCGDFFVDQPICLESLPENFVADMVAKYPEGLSQETSEGNGYISTTYVFINNGQLRLLEKKVYDWGGEFYYKNYMCPITGEKFDEEVAAITAN